MICKVNVDKAGRIVLPKPVRDKMQLQPGDSLEMQSAEDEIVLRPVRGTMPLRKKHGVWVYRTGQALPASVVDETILEVRKERDETNLGKRR